MTLRSETSILIAIPDLLIIIKSSPSETFLIETKLHSEIKNEHRQQLKNYLRSAPLNSHVDIKKINKGILLNFKKVEKFKDGINEIPDDKIDIEVWTLKNGKLVSVE